jgi:prepilin-type N-terminal cleavage/methylation domain-containing protein
MTKKVQINKRGSRGFTLVELSLVLLIIGLLIAGIQAGLYMVKQVELRSMMTDFYTYTTAYNNFLDKYRFPPGDLPGADGIFVAADCADTGASCVSTSAGDGLINYSATAAANELNRAWKHMELGKVLSTGFKKVPNSITTKIYDNAPSSRRSGLGYIMIGGPDSSTTNPDNPFGTSSNTIFIGKQKVSDSLFNGALTPEDAYNLDVKMDDGRTDTSGTTPVFSGAKTGILRAKDGADFSANNCVTTSAGYNIGGTNATSTTCRVGALLG